MSLIHTELRKLLGLPTAWLGLVLGTLLSPVVVLLNAPATRRALASGATTAADVGLTELGLGLIGAMALGVVTVSSEFTSAAEDSPGARQLTTTLLVAPDRLRLFTAKLAALVVVVAAQAALTTGASLALVRNLYTDVPLPAAGRVAGAILYWVLTALMAFGIALITRNGIVPLALLIVNSAVVSVSYLLSKVTTLALYLPDIAGARMFIQGGDYPGDMSPLTAGLVMTAWVAALLAVAAAVFRRRGRMSSVVAGSLRLARAEMLKLLTLPSLRVTAVATWAAAALLAYVEAPEPLFYCRVGFLALGVLASASEYEAGGQIRATLLAMPHRWSLQAAKVATLAIVTVPIAAITAGIAGSTGTSGVGLPGGVASLTMTTLLAAALATALRGAVSAMVLLLTVFFVLMPALRLPDGPATVVWWTAGAVAIATLTACRRDTT